MRQHLCDDELAEFNRCLTKMTRWLSECMDSSARYLPAAYATWIINPMSRIESLLLKVSARAKEEQRKQEHKERWCAAYLSMDPPVDDAREYLDDNERNEFMVATRRAVDALIARGAAYLTDVRAVEYGWWLERIQARKEEEARRLEAIEAADKYNRRLNEEIASLASRLDDRPEDLVKYFRTEIRDRRYTDHRFDYVLSGDDEMNLDCVLVGAANRRLEQLLSDELRSFIATPSQYYRSYFPLPVVNYRCENAPCIDINFDVFAAAYAAVQLKTATRVINGYEFTLPVMQEADNNIPPKPPKLLAYYHVVLTPKELRGRVFWRSIPLPLLKGLLGGETSPDGCTITEASGSVTTYRVRGFEQEIQIPDRFAEYLNQIGTIDEMVATGIMSKKVGVLIQEMLGQVEVRAESPRPLEKHPRHDSMKDRAYRLFDEGRRPSDPEVKALGLKPTTVYRYFQSWKKAAN